MPRPRKGFIERKICPNCKQEVNVFISSRTDKWSRCRLCEKKTMSK